MKRQIAWILTLLALLTTFAGCGRKEPITITVWHYYTAALRNEFEGEVAEFNSTIGKERGIILDVTHMEDIDTLTAKIIESSQGIVGSDPLPDLIFAYNSTVYDLDKLGLIANIQPYFTKKELDKYIPAYLEEGLIGANKELLSFPVAKSTELIYIENVAYQAFKNAVNTSEQYDDVDDSMFATFEGISQIANIYYDWTDSQTPDVPNDGKAFFGLDSTENYVSVCARQLTGTPPVTVTGGTAALTFERETAQTLWEFYATGIATGRFAEIGWYRADDMKTGDLISYLGSSGGASYFPLSLETGGASYETELLVLPQPVFKGKSAVTLQQGAGMSVIKTEEKRQKAAAEFLKWFTSPEQNVGYSIVSGYSPVMKLEYTQKFLDPALKEMSDSGDVLNKNIAGVLSQAAGQMDTYTLSFDAEYPGSYDIRNMLGESMSEFAASGDTFENWYSYIQDEFKRMVAE